MRDEKIIQAQEQERKRTAIIYRQLQFLDSRFLAYEKVLGSTWNKLKFIFNHKWLVKEVERVQLEILKEHDKAMMEAAEKANEEKAKPKIKIVGANGIPKLGLMLVAALLSIGCVSLKKHNDIIASISKSDFSSKSELEQCQREQAQMRNELKAKTDRLRRFNQVDENGNLRKLNLFKGEVDPNGWDGPDGSEPWLK